MKTDLTRVMGVDVPIVPAPMSDAGGPPLAPAVCDAGGLGTLPLWEASVATRRDKVRELRERTARPFAVNLDASIPKEERLVVCVEEGGAAVALFWGLSADLSGQRMIRDAASARY